MIRIYIIYFLNYFIFISKLKTRANFVKKDYYIQYNKENG